jgi:signal transduction histidine kinase
MHVDYRRLVDGLNITADMAGDPDEGLPAVSQLVETLAVATQAAGATFTSYDVNGGRVMAATGAMEWALGQPIAGEFILAEIPRVWSGRVEVLPPVLAEPLLSRGLQRMVGARVGPASEPIGAMHVYYAQRWGEISQDLVSAVILVANCMHRLYRERKDLRPDRTPDEDDRDLFLAAAGHELRTPVTVIKGYAGTLADRWEALDDHERRGAAQVLTQRADELARLVDRLLAAAGGSSAQHWLTRSVPFDLIEGLHRALADLPATSRESVKLELPAALPPAYGDPAALSMIVAELVGNALRHAEPPVDLDAGSDERSVYFRVGDRGTGIDPRDAERAFERFWQGNRAVENGGVGLGLYLVRRIIERQNGWVSLRPRDGGGTVAEVRLPRVDGPHRPKAPGEA